MKKKVLIAVDEPRTDRGLRRKLLEQSYELFWASDLQDALDRFDISLIDLLLIDLDVPMRDGWSALPRVTQLNPALPMIGLTERSDVNELALQARLSAVAEKPLHVRNLLNAIDDILTRGSGLAGFRYVLPRTAHFRQEVPCRAAELGLCPAVYNGWGINE